MIERAGRGWHAFSQEDIQHNTGPGAAFEVKTLGARAQAHVDPFTCAEAATC